MVRLCVGVLVAVAATGCGKPGAASVDAAAGDGDIDAPDAPRDAAPDSPTDAPEVPDHSPACTTTPTILLDTSPRRIGNIARSGNVLYVSAYEVDSFTDEVSNSVILSIDLTTESEAFAPVVTPHAAALWPVGNDVYASIPAAGTILRLHPGVAPVTVVSNRPTPIGVTADATHVYWSEQPSVTSDDVIKRMPLGGGTIDQVMECDDARQLFVVGNDLYCFPTRYGPKYAPKTGGGPEVGVSYNSQIIWSTILDGGSFYFVNFYNNPQLYRMVLPSGPPVLLSQLTTFGRYAGLAATSTYFYTVDMDYGVRRIRRSDLDVKLIFNAVGTLGDPVLWNDDLYVAASNPNLSGQRYVMHCVD